MSTDHGTPVRPPVVVGIDGSPSALQATRWAARHACLTKASLHLIAAFGWVEESRHDHHHTPSVNSSLRVRSYREVLFDMRADHLEEAVRVANQTAPHVSVTQDVMIGHPVPVLCAAATNAELLVVGSRGLGGVAAMVLGSTAVGIATHAGCPVVVVREDESAANTLRPVVVGVDQTPASESALAFAFAEASLHHTPLVVAHMIRFKIGLLPVSDAAVDTALDAERDRLGERIGRWTDKYPDVETSVVAQRAHAAAGLVELSRTALLTVVGSRGRGGFAGQLLGSVSQAVLHHSYGPVAVVRTSE